MHLRAHGILAKMLSALHDAEKYPVSTGCFSIKTPVPSADTEFIQAGLHYLVIATRSVTCNVFGSAVRK